MAYVICFHAQYDSNVIWHVEIADRNRDFLSLWTREFYTQCYPAGEVTILKIPVSFKSLLKKRRELGMLQYPRCKEIAKDPIDFPFRVYMKQVMSCSQLVAYLLGLDEFWYYKPTDMYKKLIEMEGVTAWHLRIKEWK